MELFEDSKASSWAGITETDPLLDEIKKKLAEDLQRYEDEYTEKRNKDKYYWGEYRDQKRIRPRSFCFCCGMRETEEMKRLLRN